MLKKTVLFILAGASIGFGAFSFEEVKGKSSELVTKLSQSGLDQEIILIKETVQKLAKTNSAVTLQVNSFLDSLQKGVDEGALGEKEAKNVLQALVFAAEKHKAQVRKNKEKTPYII